MLSHSFDRFYVVTKFEMPKVKDLKLVTFTFGLTCEHLNNPKSLYTPVCKTLSENSPLCKIGSKNIGLILPLMVTRNKRFIGTSNRKFSIR